jgi:hypothetical protein
VTFALAALPVGLVLLLRLEPEAACRSCSTAQPRRRWRWR